MLVEAPRPRVVREHRHAGWLAVTAVCLGAFMGQLDASIVTLTFPALEQQFHAPLAAVQWVSLSYLLALVALVAAAGRVADAAGRKLLYLWGFAVFTLASAACGFASGLVWLILFRAIQAGGAAMLQANSVALVVNSVRRERMRTALGVQAAAQALGLALGPTFGGVLVTSMGWQWVFWVNVPVGVVALIAGHYLLPRTHERTPLGRFDWQGLLLLVTATVGLLLMLSGFSGLPISSGTELLLLAVSAIAVPGFLFRERRAANPLLDLAVLRPRAISMGLVGALCAYVVLFGPLALFPQVLGDGARVGLLLSALPAGFAFTALTADRFLPSHYGTPMRSIVGGSACVGSTATLVVVHLSSGWIAPLLLILGLGLGLFIPANNTTIMEGIPVRVSAMGGGMVNMSRGIGTALGVALVTFCLHLANGSRSSEAGPHLALATLTLFALVAAVSGLTARSGRIDPQPEVGAGAADPLSAPNAIEL